MSDRINVVGTDLVIGEEYVRRDIHGLLGGSIQGGISPSGRLPVVLLFSGPGGHEHGYGFDGWKSKDTYEYTGQGRPSLGNQRFTKGNKAVRDHVQNGKRLLLFQQVMEGRRKTNRVRFEGEMVYVDHRIEHHDSAGYGRDVIVFILKPA